MTPYSGARQIVRPAECSPNEAALRRIERNPIRRVAPGVRDSLGGALPGSAAIRALEETDVGIVHINVAGIEWIELDPVTGGHIETARRPGLAYGFGIHLQPGGAAI